MRWTTRRRRFGGQEAIDGSRRYVIPRLSAVAERPVTYGGSLAAQALAEKRRLESSPGATPSAFWRQFFKLTGR